MLLPLSNALCKLAVNLLVALRNKYIYIYILNNLTDSKCDHKYGHKNKMYPLLRFSIVHMSCIFGKEH